MSNKLNGFVFLALALLFGMSGHSCLKASNGFKRVNYAILCYILFALKIFVKRLRSLLIFKTLNGLS